MNAAQAIVHQGVVEIRLERVQCEARQPLLHGELAAGPYVRFSVSDTGCGMSAEVLQRAFDPFFTTKKAGEGTGLGLSIVHGIVSDHGGALDIQTEPGRGTRVAAWLPAARERDAPPTQSDPVSTAMRRIAAVPDRCSAAIPT
jgi:signal transduction histidine kinase